TVSGGSCTPTISAATNINATFTLTPATFVLSAAGVGQGTGTVTSDLNDVLTATPISCTSTGGALSGKCSGTFNQNTVVTLTAAAALSGVGSCSGGNCTFNGFSGIAGCGAATTCAVTVTRNITASADFELAASGTWASVQSVNKTNCGA